MKKLKLIGLLIIVVNFYGFSQHHKTSIINNYPIKQDGIYKICYMNKFYEIDTTIMTIKMKNVDSSTYNIIRINKLDYADIRTPQNMPFLSFVNLLETDTNILKYDYATIGEYTAIYPNDTFAYKQWYLHAINAFAAWDISMGISDIVVAILDSGIDWMHDDLYENIHINRGEHPWQDQDDPTTGNDIDDDNNGFIDDRKGWNFEDNINDSRTDDPHGTIIAGIIAAQINNQYGIAGIAGGNNGYGGVKLLSYSTGAFGVKTAILDEAIIAAVDNGARIIQISSDCTPSWAIDSALQYAADNNVVVVCAAGNSSFVGVRYPASYPTTIAVGAIDTNYNRADFSSYGKELDLVAPGDYIFSTAYSENYLSNHTAIRYEYDENDSIIQVQVTEPFVIDGGTSFAAPMVSGIAALMLSVNHHLTARQVRNIIEQTTRKINDTIYSYQNDTLHPNGTWNNEMGYGLVDAYAAVSEAIDYFTDLYIRDDIEDDSSVPNLATCLWNSPDIWLEDTNGQKVERPNDNTEYYVCVRIHNHHYSSAPICGEKLFINWAKAGINDFWSESWTDERSLSCGLPQGGTIGDPAGILIPSMPADSSIVMRIPWITPSGYDYAGCTDFNEDPWHFCLLARVHDNDIILHEKEKRASTYEMVKNHNNVAQLNVYFNKSKNYRTVVRMGNPTDNTRSVNLGIDVQDNDQGERISDFADIEITFDDNIFPAVQREDVAGAVWIDSTDDVYTLRITDFDNFYLPLDLDEGIDGTILTSVHFYADIVPSDSVFTFDLILYEAEGDIAGGQHYECTRVMDRYFQAGITGDIHILVEDTCTALYAVTIGEPADYVWYDDQGNVVGTDSVLLIPLPFQMTTYSLSITAHSDGYRAFGDTSVVLYVDSTIIIDPIEGGEFLTSISPNPANNQVAITYRLPKNETQAVLRILGSQGQRLYQQNISGNREAESRKIVNTSNFAPGQYKVMLISRRGRVLDGKTLIIE